VTSLDTLAMLFPNVATTHGITVRVAVSYLAEQSDPTINRWFWSYHVRIENGAERSVQLLSRSWKITDGRGVVHEVHGEGVVGEMPLIAPDGRHSERLDERKLSDGRRGWRDVRRGHPEVRAARAHQLTGAGLSPARLRPVELAEACSCPAPSSGKPNCSCSSE
jgi:hypothetical protein